MKGRVQIYKCGSTWRHKVSAKIYTRCLISLQFAFRVSDQDRLRLKFPLLKSSSQQIGSLVWIITLLYSSVIWKSGPLIVYSLINVLTLSLEKIDDSWCVCHQGHHLSVPITGPNLTPLTCSHLLSPCDNLSLILHFLNTATLFLFHETSVQEHTKPSSH